jgi:SAM-dependent methyltransferase
MHTYRGDASYHAGVASPLSRFDPIADWYMDFTSHWADRPLALLPEQVAGQRILDQGCGYGVASRYLASRGALVTGVDLSSAFVARACELEAEHPLGIRYLCADATRTDWWDGEPFDGVLSNMALMDIDDLDGALATAATVVKPGGWFSFSVFHPCYPGGPKGSWSGLPSWPPEHGYSQEGWWSTRGEAMRGRVGANHRMLSTYLNAVLRAGFHLEAFAEKGRSVPVYLIVRARRIP